MLSVPRARGERGPEPPRDGRPHGLTPLVGREEEVTLLRERWAQSTEGLGQVVLLSGEAGIGKSRLVQVLKDARGAASRICAWSAAVRPMPSTVPCIP